MKTNLFNIDNSERQRILEMHETATKKQYLNEQSSGSFIYSQNPNAVSADTENFINYQKYLGLSGTMDDLKGKKIILYKTSSKETNKPSVNQENEYTTFTVASISQNDKNVYLYSMVNDPNTQDNESMLNTYLRISDTPNINYMTYMLKNDAQPVKVYNEALKNIVLSRAFPERHKVNTLYKN